jgi:hypothetical protein
MKVDVSVDLDDLFEYFNGDELAKVISGELKIEIMKIVKRDPRYKAFINKKATETLNSLDI